MQPESLLVANRGEIAVRVLRAAAELGIRTTAVYAEDDARSLHVKRADAAVALPGKGARAYLDADAVIAAARSAGCDAIHPGYGFLSESAAFARRCEQEGIAFVGPTAETLAQLGDKLAARALAARCDVPLLPGTRRPTDLDEARAALEAFGRGGAIVLKAVAGGGGRGVRIVRSADELEDAFARCRSEAKAAFGSGDLYVERFLPRARHVEVQIVGDGSGAVSHLHERECTLQRRHQKLVEVAPSPSLGPRLRARLHDAALRMARELGFRSLGTFEFLVDASGDAGAGTVEAGRDAGAIAICAEDALFAFLEANPRLQVEHTVTEEVTGLDLVRAQLELAGGAPLSELGLAQADVPRPRGFSIQVRVNTEEIQEDGSTRPASGTLSVFEPPAGPGLRTETAAYAGYTTSARFDALLAKLIAHAPSGGYRDALARAHRALCELRVEGVATNAGLLQAVLEHADVRGNRIHTRFVEERARELLARARAPRRLYFESAGPGSAPPAGARRAGARLASSDPLAVLAYGRSPAAALDAPDASGESDAIPVEAEAPGPPGTAPVRAPMQGSIVSLVVAPGDAVRAGQTLLVMDSMKMEHEVRAPASGVVRRIEVAPGDTVRQGYALLFVEEGEVEGAGDAAEEAVDLDRIRPDLAEALERHAFGEDARRPDAVARRQRTGQRTARENVADLCDPGSFVEYGPLVIAAQRRRRPLQELIERTPADGLVAGVGCVNRAQFGEERSRCVVMSYDYTVLAGTQGTMNHRKKDRMFELAERARLPVVFFTEGGGGRPGDTDGAGVAGLDCLAFWLFGGLSGRVPLVALTSGRCFAGNAALVGCCDVVIATAGANIGMGGPAMVEGGGLGVFRPEEIGPLDVQRRNGVVDVAVRDEAEAVAVARRYLGYFQGPVAEFACADQRRLRHAIPENRLRVYDVRAVIETLADEDSLLELRRDFGPGMVTALARIEGRPVGIVANNPMHLAGAIDSPGADKAARFMQLCDAFRIPLVLLCDTPGIMVGPEVEKTGLVRHASRMFVVGASLTVPFMTIVLRKGYGLGAQAMAGGSFRAPLFTVGWPTSEFGGMGLEGAVKLGFRNELAEIDDPQERQRRFEEMVARMYEHGKGVNMASHFEIDDVIDPADSRRWITGALRSAPAEHWRDVEPRRPCVDAW